MEVADHLCSLHQVTRISHFDYVTTEDLMGIGMGKPAARRLLDTVKKRKGTIKKKLIQTFISQSANSNNKEQIRGQQLHRADRSPDEQTSVAAASLTCLIKESVSFVFLFKLFSD